MEREEVPFLRNLGFLLTYRCQIACPHCIIECSPKRQEMIPLEKAVRWIKDASRYRQGYIKAVSLTGGEPFIDLDYLRELLNVTERLDLISSVVTNAWWASTKQEAKQVLGGLPRLGMLAISTDVHHLKEIPLENVLNAFRSARSMGIPCRINVCTENKDDPEYLSLISRLQEEATDIKISTVLTFPVGRAARNVDLSSYRHLPEPPKSSCAYAASPIVMPNGDVLACVGPLIELKEKHPLFLGNLGEESLEQILDRAENNVILHAIRVWGPRMLVGKAKEKGYGGFLPESYIKDSACNACYDIISNRKLVPFFVEIANDKGFHEEVAYARLHYLREKGMLFA